MPSCQGPSWIARSFCVIRCRQNLEQGPAIVLRATVTGDVSSQRLAADERSA